MLRLPPAKIIITGTLLFVLVAVWVGFISASSVEYETRRVNVLPGGFSTLDWSNPQNIFSQDVSPDSAAGDFNESNSAFLRKEAQPAKVDPDKNSEKMENLFPADSNDDQEGEDNPEGPSGTPVEAGTNATSSDLNSGSATESQMSDSGSATNTSLQQEQASSGKMQLPDSAGLTETPAFSPPESSSLPDAQPDLITPSSDSSSDVIPSPQVIETSPSALNSDNPIFVSGKPSLFSFGKKILNRLARVAGIKSSFADQQNIEGGKSIELYDFKVTEEFMDSEIDNAQLRASLAVKGDDFSYPEGGEGDLIFVQYYYNNEWLTAAETEITEEMSNSKNGGYFLYSLPVFGSYRDISQLKVRFVYQARNSSQKTEIYIESVWLEIDETVSSIVQDGKESEYREINTRVNEGMEIKERKKELIVDPEAKHHCLISPFSRKVNQGSSVTYEVMRAPFSDQAAYELKIGDLPAGAEALFEAENIKSSSTPKIILKISTSGETPKSSFNISVIYDEKKADGLFSSSVCQLNLVVQ